MWASKYFYITICLSLFLVQCTQFNEVKIHTVDEDEKKQLIDSRSYIAPLSYVTLTEDKVEDIIKDIKVINLESSPDVELKYIRKTIMGSNGDFFIMDKRTVYHFSSEGNFIRKYGKRGIKNNQYYTLTDIAYNSRNGNLLILDGMNKVLFFDSNTGEFIKSLTPDWGGDPLRLDGIAPDETTGGFYIFSAKLGNKDIQKNRYFIHQFNKKGKKVAEGLECEDFVMDISPVTQSYGNRYLVNPLGTETTVWEIAGKGKFSSLYGVDFEGQSVASKRVFSRNGSTIEIGDLVEADGYKIPVYFQDTRDFVSFQICGPHAESYVFIYSRHDNTGIRVSAPNNMTFPIKFCASDSKYLYTIFDKYTFEGMEEHADPITQYLMKKYGTLSEGENPRIIAIQFDFKSL